VVTFFVTLFVLVMQFFWLYMDELIGKGLGIGLILQLLFYMSTTLVPMALPLAVLLASIMTFGSMGENYELVAIKSSGVSLLRVMRPLFVFMLGVSALAFVFSNNIIPVANLKAYTLLYDLRNSKLSLSIREGEFNNEINGYAIRVGSKSKDGKKIRNVIIYDNSGGIGNDKLILAKEGEMINSPDKRFLIFRLKDGWRYEEMSGSRGTNGKYSQVRMHFNQSDKVFDMSSFTKVQHTDESVMKGGQAMMNIVQLEDNIDSLVKNRPRDVERFSYDLRNFLTFRSELSKSLKDSINKLSAARPYTGSFISTIPDSVKKRVLDLSESQVRSSKLYVEISTSALKLKDELMVNLLIEWHRKFALSFACILLYLIGAPLGAIIRKGGIGLPLIIAVIFFVTYIIVSKTGEQLSKTQAVMPYFGMWISTLMLLPFAFVFIREARNDSRLFSKEWYVRNFGRLFQYFRNKTSSAKKKKLAA
jgi:lipopolysaccharide export system permease protein